MSSSKNSGQFGFPGLEYIDRVGQAWLSAVTLQREIVTEAWDQMRQGTFEHSTMLQSWVKAMDAFQGIAVEVSRGPGHVYQPVWLCFDYTQGKNSIENGDPEVLEGTVRIARNEAAQTTLEPTRFSNLDLKGTIDADAYEICDWVQGSRSQIHVKLDKSKLVKPGQYISFILPKGRTGEPPLAIVMLRIYPAGT